MKFDKDGYHQLSVREKAKNKRKQITRSWHTSKIAQNTSQIDNDCIIKSKQKNIAKKLFSSINQDHSEINELMKSFNHSSILFFCQKFQKSISQSMQLILQKFIRLQYKIAQCQHHFNNIELQLSKKSKQIKGLTKQNKQLTKANQQIESRLLILKQNYDINRKIDKQQGIQSSLSNIQQYLNKLNYQKNKRNQIYARIEEICKKSQDIHPYTDIETKHLIQQIFENLIQLPQNTNTLSPSITQIVQQVIIQNIDLKFKIAELQLKYKTDNKQ